MSIARFKALDDRCDEIESDLQSMRKSLHSIKNEHMKTQTHVKTLQNQMTNIALDTQEILKWVTGGAKVFGFAKKNWKTAIIFGAGIMTSLGFGNPELLHFLVKFFGG